MSFRLTALKRHEATFQGQTLLQVTNHGKAMLNHFENGWSIYSHNQLYGIWKVTQRGMLPKTKRSLRLALHTATHSTLLYSASDISAWPTEELCEHPGNGNHNSFRGGPLARLDERVRACIDECGNRIDQRAVTFFWQRAIDQPLAAKQRWIHADLHPTNLLAAKDRLTAAIDFGLLGVGDPACDLMTAWTILDSQGRQTLQSCTRATPDL